MYTRAAVPLAICSLWLMSCAKAVKPNENADLTLRRDGSHFYGTVVRRDDKSITLTDAGGAVHTFLMTDLTGMRYTAAGPKTAPPTTPAFGSSTPPTPLPAGGELFGQPRGTQFAVRSNGFLDTCCVRLNDIELGFLDADIKGPGGGVMIPKGANVTFMVKDQSIVGGRLSMTFELTTADYGGHHYMITPGAVMTVTGEKNVAAYTGEALPVGKRIHLDDNSALSFTAATPITFKLST